MEGYKGLSDNELVLLLKEGDRHAFNEVYARYFPFLYRYAYNILKDEEECSDALQEIFIWLWENRKKLDIVSLRPYLGAAVKYRLARAIKASRRHAEILSAGAEALTTTVTGADMEAKELRKVIDEFVATLPRRAREIFLLSRGQYFSNKEIAARLGISEKTVENQLTIALRKLRAGLARRLFFFLFF